MTNNVEEIENIINNYENDINRTNQKIDAYSSTIKSDLLISILSITSAVGVFAAFKFGYFNFGEMLFISSLASAITVVSTGKAVKHKFEKIKAEKKVSQLERDKENAESRLRIAKTISAPIREFKNTASPKKKAEPHMTQNQAEIIAMLDRQLEEETRKTEERNQREINKGGMSK